MNKTAIIIIVLLSLALIASFYMMSLNNQTDTGKTKSIEHERDSAMTLFRSIQMDYDSKNKNAERLEADLITHKAKVKELEVKLSELLKRERYAQIENKRVIQAYSNNQLDSAFMAIYPVPDSLRN